MSRFHFCMFCLAIGISCALTSSVKADFLTFSNLNPITIPSSGQANPYPSTINVSGVSGTIVNFTLALNGFSHTFPDDVGAVVVSPTGTAVLLFSGPGDGTDAVGVNFVFDDNAAATVPENGALASGTYRPGLFQWDDNFPAPGPGLTYGFSFAPYRTENPNGNWNLFVLDSNGGDAGSIAGGWSVTFEITAVPEPGSMALVGLVAGAGWIFRRRKCQKAN